MRRFNKILILALLAAAATVAVLLLKPAEQPVSRQAGPDAGYLKAIAPPSALVPPPGPRGPAEPAAGTSEPSGAPATGGAQAPRDRVAAAAEISPEPPIPTEQALDQASTPQQQEVAPGTPDAQGTEAPAAARLVPEAPLAIHRVGAGDTLSKLAKNYYGDSARWNLIQKANPGLPKVLQVGSEVVIPVAPQVDR